MMFTFHKTVNISNSASPDLTEVADNSRFPAMALLSELISGFHSWLCKVDLMLIAELMKTKSDQALNYPRGSKIIF